MGDEASARSLLAEMQARLGRDPHEALGLVGSPTPADVRNAFLQLTKTFHPQKFARMAPDIQRLANEVFLSLRAAHDTLTRVSVAPTNRKSGPLPTFAPRVQTSPTGPQRPPTGQVPVLPAFAAPPNAPPPARTPTAPPRTATTTPAAAPPGNPHQITQPMRPLARAQASAPPPRTAEVDARPASRLAQPSPPPGQVRAPSPRPASAPGAPTAAPSAAPTAPAAPTGSGATADRELAPILELIKLGQLAAAKVALETLVARAPSVPRYQALLHFTRGREAQLAKRLDEARVELQDALQIDPDLAVAKTALAELFTRRK